MYAIAKYIFLKNVHSLTHSGGGVVSDATLSRISLLIFFFFYEDDFQDLTMSTVYKFISRLILKSTQMFNFILIFK